MGCTELQEMLAAIQAATECACEQLTELPKDGWPAGGTLPGQPDYDDYTSPVYAGEGDPPGGLPTWDDWHDYVCIAAQHVFNEQIDLMSRLELWYSAGAAITFALFQTLVVGTAVVPPLALAMTILGILAVAGTALSVIAVGDWIEDNMHDLVCQVFLAPNVDAAIAGIGGIVTERWDLLMGRGFFDNIVNRKVVSSIFDVTVPDYPDWVGNYSAAYCEDCELPPDPYHREWYFPPCPNTWELFRTAACDANGNIKLDAYGAYAISDSWILETGGTLDVTMRLLHYSNRPNDYDCGVMRLQKWTGATWGNVRSRQLKSAGAYVWRETVEGPFALVVGDGDEFRLRIEGHAYAGSTRNYLGRANVDFEVP